MSWFYETQPNGAQAHSDADLPPPTKRPLLLNPSPFLYPLHTSHLFDYTPAYQPGYQQVYHATAAPAEMLATFERSRDAAAAGAPPPEQRATSGVATGAKSDDEWRNINTMLNCILSMVEKTKRALAILQQRGSGAEQAATESGDVKRACSEIMAAAVRQTEERVAELRRRAEDAVNQVKRQALAELARAAELAAAERGRVDRLLLDARKSPPAAAPAATAAAAGALSPAAATAQQNCWNCGRKAQETCSGCNAARYCGAFCQHKDWENHHQVCCGRDLKPTTALTTSPPATQPKPLPRSTTPISSSTVDRHTVNSDRHTINPDRIALPTERHAASERLPSESRLSLTTLNNVERMLANSSERPASVASNERLALATLSTAQGLIGGIGGKK